MAACMAVLLSISVALLPSGQAHGPHRSAKLTPPGYSEKQAEKGGQMAFGNEACTCHDCALDAQLLAWTVQLRCRREINGLSQIHFVDSKKGREGGRAGEHEKNSTHTRSGPLVLLCSSAWWQRMILIRISTAK